MEKEINGSKTQKALVAAFESESADSVKYRIFAERAREEGREYEAEEFSSASEEAYERARAIFLELSGAGDTDDNLNDSDYGDKFKKNVYSKLASVVSAEGFSAKSELLRRLARTSVTISGFNDFGGRGEWVCVKCGNRESGERPSVCPLCGKSGSFKRIN